MFNECTANVINNDKGVLIECYNIDTRGSVQKLSNGTFDYVQSEHPVKVGTIYKETCQHLMEFISYKHFNTTEYISQHKPNIKEIDTLINLFFKNNKDTPFIDMDQFLSIDELIKKRDR